MNGLREKFLLASGSAVFTALVLAAGYEYFSPTSITSAPAEELIPIGIASTIIFALGLCTNQSPVMRSVTTPPDDYGEFDGQYDGGSSRD